MLDNSFIHKIFNRIDQNKTHDVSYYEPSFKFCQQNGTAELNVSSADGAAVALTSSINSK